jgi:hypothetical protein
MNPIEYIKAVGKRPLMYDSTREGFVARIQTALLWGGYESVPIFHETHGNKCVNTNEPLDGDEEFINKVINEALSLIDPEYKATQEVVED